MIAKCREEVGIKAIDFYSIGHIIIGYISFLVYAMIFFLMFNDYIPIFALLYAVETGILWELLENYVLDKTYLKFNNRKDSLQNSFTDVLFDVVGGLIGLPIVIFLCLYAILYITIIFLIASILIMDVYSKRTLNKNDNNGRRR